MIVVFPPTADCVCECAEALDDSPLEMCAGTPCEPWRVRAARKSKLATTPVSGEKGDVPRERERDLVDFREPLRESVRDRPLRKDLLACFCQAARSFSNRSPLRSTLQTNDAEYCENEAKKASN